MTTNWFEALNKIGFWLLSLCLLPSLVLAQDSLSQAIPLDPNIRQGTLPNGMTYLIRHNSEPKNYAELRLAVRVGSNAEEDDQQGAAHFIKHAVFRGTKNFSKKEIQNFSRRTGFPSGPDSTAESGFDETYFIIPIPLDSAGMLEEGLNLLKDRAHNALLDSVEIEKERGFLLEETQWDAGPELRMRIAYFKSLLKNSRYGERLATLNEEHIKAIKPERLRQFYQDWYRPDLMAVAAVGDFDADEVEKLIRQKFGSIPKSESPRKRIDYPFPLIGGTDVFIATDSAATECTVSVKHYWPDFEVRTMGEVRDDLINRFFGEMINERMKGSHTRGGFLGGANEFSPFVSTKEVDKLEEYLESILEQMAYVRQFGFTQLEFDAVKRDNRETLVGAPYEVEMHSGFYAQEYIFYFVSGYPMFDKAFYADIVSSKIDSITLEEVNQWSKKVLNSDRRSIVITAPESQKEQLPTEARVRELIDSAGRGAKPPIELQIKKLIENLKGEKLLSRKQHEKAGVSEIVLNNGVRVLLKPFDPAINSIQFVGKAKGGTSLFMDEPENVRYAQHFLSRHAISPFDHEKLEDYMNKQHISVSATIDNTSTTISGLVQVDSTNSLETALQIVYAYFTVSELDTSAARLLLSADKALLVKEGPDAQTMLDDAFNLALGGKDKAVRLMTATDIDKIDVHRPLTIYKTLLANASDFTFVFAGPFEVEEIEPLLEKYLGNIPTNKNILSKNSADVILLDERIEKTVINSQNLLTGARLIFGGGYDVNPEAQIQFGIIKKMIHERLREALPSVSGILLGVWNTNEKVLLPANYYSITVDFICPLNMVNSVIDITTAEIKKIKAEGVDPSIIEQHLPFLTQIMKIKMSQSDFWAEKIMYNSLNERDLNEILDQEKYMKAISPASTKAAANKYFTDDFFIKVVLTPEKK